MEKVTVSVYRTPEIPGDYAGVCLGALPVASFTSTLGGRSVYRVHCGPHEAVCEGIPAVLAFVERTILTHGGFFADRLQPIYTPTKEPNE